MEREPKDFDRSSLDEAVFNAQMEALAPVSGILHVDDDDPEGDAQAEADIAAGRVYPHEVVGEWLNTWGRPGRLPFKEWLAQRDG